MTTMPTTLAFAGFAARLWHLARFVVPRLDPDERRRLTRDLARETLDLLGIDVAILGQPCRDGQPVLLAPNHVSWLDVWAVNAAAPARFVAKAEVARWPVAGTITRGFGAFFIKRGCPRDAWRVKNRLAAHLRADERVAGFPEGTTTDGSRVGHFHPALFQAAVDAGALVQPVAIRYRAPDGSRCQAAPFIDDMTFVGSLRRVLAAPGVRAEVTFLPPRRGAGACRKELAAWSFEAIARELQLPAGRPAPMILRPAA